MRFSSSAVLAFIATSYALPTGLNVERAAEADAVADPFNQPPWKRAAEAETSPDPKIHTAWKRTAEADAEPCGGSSNRPCAWKRDDIIDDILDPRLHDAWKREAEAEAEPCGGSSNRPCAWKREPIVPVDLDGLTSSESKTTSSGIHSEMAAWKKREVPEGLISPDVVDEVVGVHTLDAKRGCAGGLHGLCAWKRDDTEAIPNTFVKPVIKMPAWKA